MKNGPPPQPEEQCPSYSMNKSYATILAELAPYQRGEARISSEHGEYTYWGEVLLFKIEGSELVVCFRWLVESESCPNGWHQVPAMEFRFILEKCDMGKLADDPKRGSGHCMGLKNKGNDVTAILHLPDGEKLDTTHIPGFSADLGKETVQTTATTEALAA
jgi:hypothetical protein